jgi:hypothetical protein
LFYKVGARQFHGIHLAWKRVNIFNTNVVNMLSYGGKERKLENRRTNKSNWEVSQKFFDSVMNLSG